MFWHFFFFSNVKAQSNPNGKHCNIAYNLIVKPCVLCFKNFPSAKNITKRIVKNKSLEKEFCI